MQDPDYEIIQRILLDDRNAYLQLIDRYKDKGLSLAKSMLKSKEDAEEVLQDSFIRAFRALKSFEWKSSFSTWFYRILVNQCKTRLSKKMKNYNSSINDEENEYLLNLPIDEENIDIKYESHELKKTIHEEIDKLNPIYSSIITLFYLQELSYPEIAEIAELPIGTVKNRLNRARLMLSESLGKRLEQNYKITTYNKNIKNERELVS
jgi:RNA polymerase sigma factor (sigma-70 family)